MLDEIPETIKGDLKATSLALKDLQGDLKINLRNHVRQTSKSMFLAGIYSTSPLKGLPYLIEKLKKGKK